MNKELLELIKVLAHKQPVLANALNPPATEADVTLLEKAVGINLPQDFVAALRTGNGQSEKFHGIFDGNHFLSIAEIVNNWNIWKMLLEGGDFDNAKSKPENGIKYGWWNPRWIPFTSNGSGDHFCIDMDPSSEGTVGQIIFVWHDMADRQCVSDSFSTWLSALCAVEGGKP